MSRIGFSGKCGLLCLVCAAGTLSPALLAIAQTTDLRGAVSETEILPTLLSPRTTTDPDATGSTGIPAGQYQPASPGALPESEVDSGQLAEPSFLQPSATAEPQRPPSTAVERRRNRREEPAPTAQEPQAPDDELDSTSTGTVRAGTVDATGNEILPLSLRLNERARPIEGLQRRSNEDPYAPLGLRVGTFTVVSTLEEGLTWTSNANNSSDGGEALLSESTLRLNAISDWSRHRAVLNGFGTYRKSLSGEEVSDLEGGADAALELDLANGFAARASFAYRLGHESASSPVAIAGVEEQPLRHTIDASLGVEKALGRARIGITGEVRRDQYGDAQLDDGSTLSQRDRNATLALVRLRGGYEISPALIPFVEVEAGHRFYDEERDSAGYARSAMRLGARAGLSLAMSEKLSGEVSAGWIFEDIEDERLETISGLALAAALDWSPVRGTNLRFDGSTTIEGSTDAGQSGSLLYAGTLRLQRNLRSNLTGDIGVGAAWRDYAGGGYDLILSGEASLTWWLNRYAGLTGRARHERQTSDLLGRDYETTSVFMGLKLQR